MTAFCGWDTCGYVWTTFDDHGYISVDDGDCGWL